MNQFEEIISLEQFLETYVCMSNMILKLVQQEEYCEQFNGMMQQLVALFKCDRIPIEAKNICFFQRWNELMMKTNGTYISVEFIQCLAEIHNYINDTLRDNYFLDFIWPLINLEFKDQEILSEYFQFIKLFYNRNLLETIRQFNMVDIAKLLMKVTEIDGFGCCALHSSSPVKKNVNMKIQAFAELLHGILQLNILELQHSRNKELEDSLNVSIHELLSLCTKDHQVCQVQMLIQVILKLLIKLDDNYVQGIFANFESVTYLVILYNQTEFSDLKVWCLKLFHRVAHKTFMQKLILALVPPKSKKLQAWQKRPPVYFAIIEWLLDSQIELQITDNQMFDEKSVFQRNEVLELLLNYLYIVPEDMKTLILTTLFTLTKNSAANQEFLANHSHFLNTFPKFVLSYQVPEGKSLESSQMLVMDGDNIKKIFDSSLKITSSVILQGISQGRVELIFQWQKLVQLQLFKKQNGDSDNSCVDVGTPKLLIRNLFNYIFTSLFNFKSSFVQEKQSQSQWKGVALFLAAFLQLIVVELQPPSRFTALRPTPKIFVYKSNVDQEIGCSAIEIWSDFQFLPKIEQLLKILQQQTRPSNFDLAKVSPFFKPQDFSLMLNNLFKRVIGADKDNINMVRIIQSIISYYVHYMIMSKFSHEREEQLLQLLKEYRQWIQIIIIGAQQISQFRLLSNEMEILIHQTHFQYIELHLSIVSLIHDRCSMNYQNVGDESLFAHIEEIQNLQEMLRGIQATLSEYYINLSKINQFYGAQPNNFIWNYCYELIRITKQEGVAADVDLTMIINKPDQLSQMVTGQEMIAYYLDSPNMVEQKQNSQLNILEILRWAEGLFSQQQEEKIAQFQENYQRQSIVLMKDVNQTLNKYQKIQQTNQELFQLEKSIHNKSRGTSQ